MSKADKSEAIQFTLHPMVYNYRGYDESESAALEEDIREYGVINPIILWQEPGVESPWMIDGRNRYETVEKLHREGVTTAKNGRRIEANVYIFEGKTVEEAMAYARSQNEVRRSLDQSQRAASAVAAGMLRIEKEKRDSPDFVPTNPDEAGKKIAEIVAAKAGTNREYVYACARFASHNPDLLDKVKSGKLNVKQAIKIEKRRKAGLPDEAVKVEAPVESAPPPGDAVEDVLDGLKRKVHPDYAKWFAARELLPETVKAVNAAKSAVKKLSESEGGEKIVLSEMTAALNSVNKHLTAHTIYLICPRCEGSKKEAYVKGKKREDCTQCGGVGFLDQMGFNLLSDEVRAELAKTAEG